MTKLHLVKKGDTLDSIILKHRLDLERFMALNPDFDTTGIMYGRNPKPGTHIVVSVDPFNDIKGFIL